MEGVFPLLKAVVDDLQSQSLQDYQASITRVSVRARTCPSVKLFLYKVSVQWTRTMLCALGVAGEKFSNYYVLAFVGFPYVDSCN